MKVENLEKCEPSGFSYGGHGGSKRGIIIENEKWFLKYPKSTSSMDVEGLSYTTTPLSEYLGSHIYKSLDLEVHDTKLGIFNNKLVVACKDFLKDDEMILDYNMIKNDYDERVEEAFMMSSFYSDNDLEEIFVIMENNVYFKKMPELKERFWDMFIVDAFISNNDRNEGNWGLVLNRKTKDLRIAPVFDNGAAFYNKTPNDKFANLLHDKTKFKQVTYDSSVSIFTQNGKPINPLKYIENMNNENCNVALKRIVPKINFEKIKNIFDEIPQQCEGVSIISENQKEFYLNILKYRYDNILLPIYNKLLAKK